MIKRKYTDKDGVCFANNGWCIALTEHDDSKCGTYGCPFYKPEGCEDWIKIEEENCVKLYTPEEYYGGRK